MSYDTSYLDGIIIPALAGLLVLGLAWQWLKSRT